jgi:hypothetical protein
MLLLSGLHQHCTILSHTSVLLQAVGGSADKPTYKELEALVDAARKAKLEIFKVAQEATSLDREAVSHHQLQLLCHKSGCAAVHACVRLACVRGRVGGGVSQCIACLYRLFLQ